MSKYTEIKPDNENYLVVQRGEAVGHEHVFSDTKNVKLFALKSNTNTTKEMIAVFTAPAELQHISRNKLKEKDDLHGKVMLPNASMPVGHQGDVQFNYLEVEALKALHLPESINEGDVIGGVRITTQQEYANGINRMLTD